MVIVTDSESFCKYESFLKYIIQTKFSLRKRNLSFSTSERTSSSAPLDQILKKSENRVRSSRTISQSSPKEYYSKRPFPIVLLFKSNLNNSPHLIISAHESFQRPRNHRRASRNPLTREILLFVTRSAQSYFKLLLGPLARWKRARLGKKTKYVEKYRRGISVSRKRCTQETYKVASIDVYST